jgi:hypothetical protein
MEELCGVQLYLRVIPSLKGEGVIPHESPSSESLIPIFSSPLAGEDLGEG